MVVCSIGITSNCAKKALIPSGPFQVGFRSMVLVQNKHWAEFCFIYYVYFMLNNICRPTWWLRQPSAAKMWPFSALKRQRKKCCWSLSPSLLKRRFSEASYGWSVQRMHGVQISHMKTECHRKDSSYRQI